MKLNKKLLSSAMALALAGLSTVGSTYAWFTTNGTATVTNMQMTVESAQKGMYVSQPGSSVWNDTINLSTKYSGIKLAPVTSANGVDFYSMTGCTAVQTTDGSKTNSYFNYTKLTKETSSVKAGWIKQGETLGTDFYYLEETFYLAVDSTTSSITMHTDITIPESASDTVKTKAPSVLRYSVKRNGDANPAIYCPNPGTRDTQDNALNAYNALHGLDGTNNDTIVADNKAWLSAAGATKMKNSANGDATGSDFICSTAVTDVTINTSTANTWDAFKAANSSAADSLNIAGGTYYYTFVTVGIWLEGNDYNCYNSIAGAQFNCGISFTAN